MKYSLFVFASAALAFCTTAPAQIYKYVDEEGNVTYSSSLPIGAKEVDQISVEEGPPPDAVEAAQERFKRLRESADQMEAERKQREAEYAKKREEQQAASEEVPAPIIIEQPRYYYPYPSRPIARPPQRPRPPDLPSRPAPLPGGAN